MNYLFPSQRFFWSFYRVQNPFSLCIPISDKKTYIWCNVSCNVWLCMNETSKYLDLFFIRTCFIPLFRIYCSFSPMLLRACFFDLLCFCPLFKKTFLSWCLLIVSQTSLCSKFVILWFLHHWKTNRHFFVLDFSLDFHIVNKFNINNKNLLKQCISFIHVNKIKCMLHSKK